MATPARQFPAAPRPTDLHCLRNPWRVGILAALADPFYFFWWTFQLFRFSRQEGFPRARSFWWIFVPLYGLYVLWQQLDDLRQAAAAVEAERVSPGLVLSLIVGSLAADRVFASARDLGLSLVMLVAGGVLAGAALYITQSAVSSYLTVKYPSEQPRGMTLGETVATILGVLFAGLLVLVTFLPG